MNIPLSHLLIISSILFFTGIYGFLTRRNLITILMALELILNSININLVAFNKYLYPEQLNGMLFTLFVITVSAAEAAVAIAIIINLYRDFKSINVDDPKTLKY